MSISGVGFCPFVCCCYFMEELAANLASALLFTDGEKLGIVVSENDTADLRRISDRCLIGRLMSESELGAGQGTLRVRGHRSLGQRAPVVGRSVGAGRWAVVEWSVGTGPSFGERERERETASWEPAEGRCGSEVAGRWAVSGGGDGGERG
jgi:hypothetical protein